MYAHLCHSPVPEPDQPKGPKSTSSLANPYAVGDGSSLDFPVRAAATREVVLSSLHATRVPPLLLVLLRQPLGFRLGPQANLEQVKSFLPQIITYLGPTNGVAVCFSWRRLADSRKLSYINQMNSAYQSDVGLFGTQHIQRIP
jgi:hypothetical protein